MLIFAVRSVTPERTGHSFDPIEEVVSYSTEDFFLNREDAEQVVTRRMAKRRKYGERIADKVNRKYQEDLANYNRAVEAGVTGVSKPWHRETDIDNYLDYNVAWWEVVEIEVK